MKNIYKNLVLEKDIKLEETLEHLESIQKVQKFIESTELLQNIVRDLFEVKHQLTEELTNLPTDKVSELDLKNTKLIYIKSIDKLDLVIDKYGLTEEIGCSVCNDLLSERLNQIVTELSGSYETETNDFVDDIDDDELELLNSVRRNPFIREFDED